MKTKGRKRQTSAVAGGVGVLVVTAFAAFSLFFNPSAPTTIRYVGVALLVLLLAGAAILARFVAKHGDEIGEARFDTANGPAVQQEEDK